MPEFKPDNILVVNTDIKNLFVFWMKFLKPQHGLTNKEIDVAASFLWHRFIMSNSISDNNILNKAVFNLDVKKLIMDECDVAYPHFQIILGKLRKAGFIIDNAISSKYVPRIKIDEQTDKKTFNFLISFKISDE